MNSQFIFAKGKKREKNSFKGRLMQESRAELLAADSHCRNNNILSSPLSLAFVIILVQDVYLNQDNDVFRAFCRCCASRDLQTKHFPAARPFFFGVLSFELLIDNRFGGGGRPPFRLINRISLPVGAASEEEINIAASTISISDYAMLIAIKCLFVFRVHLIINSSRVPPKS